jgi:hypothetical protein
MNMDKKRRRFYLITCLIVTGQFQDEVIPQSDRFMKGACTCAAWRMFPLKPPALLR